MMSWDGVRRRECQCAPRVQAIRRLARSRIVELQRTLRSDSEPLTLYDTPWSLHPECRVSCTQVTILRQSKAAIAFRNTATTICAAGGVEGAFDDARTAADVRARKVVSMNRALRLALEISVGLAATALIACSSSAPSESQDVARSTSQAYSTSSNFGFAWVEASGAAPGQYQYNSQGGGVTVQVNPVLALLPESHRRA